MGIDASMVAVLGEVEISRERVQKLAHEVCAVFGASRFFVHRPNQLYPRSLQRALELVEIELHGTATRVVEVNLSGRYYGPGYERGDACFYLVLAQWLEHKIPGCQVLYGGDDHLRPFGKLQRELLLEHLCSEHGSDYGRWRVRGEQPPSCDYCLEPMDCMRQGGGTHGYLCAACGLRVIVRAGVEVARSEGSEWPEVLK